MVKRKRLGLSYTYNENWIGGTYYIENLVDALNSLPDTAKPHIVLITNNRNDLKAARRKLNYPYLSFQLGSGENNRLFQFINKVTGRLFSKKIFSQKIKNLDAVFPYYDCIQQSLSIKKIFWIPDFQEHFIPELCTQDIIDNRKHNQSIIQAFSGYLVLSSNNARQHFEKIYPGHRVNVSVIPFAVNHPNFTHLNLASVLKKYNLKERYFICPNQFWKHKNQLTVLKAVHELKNNGVDVLVAFTGNTTDYRNPGYFNELKAYVDKNDLSPNIIFLGFIDRLEQLLLMKNAIAIIQPSLFEGWSTVVEDAKSLNKFLIASDIEVHKEQLENSSALFFDPSNAIELAKVIKIANDQPQIPDLYNDYAYPDNVKLFGSNFMALLRD